MIIDQPERLLENMATQIRQRIDSGHIEHPAMVGIHTGGAWIAAALHKQVGIEEALGTLDISFYRDDFSRIGMSPEVKPSHLPFAIDDRHIILVDDVLYTGRTIRAALNELFDYGRPASITLAVMVVRSGRELPICADISGTHIQLDKHQHIKLQGPEPLSFKITELTEE